MQPTIKIKQACHNCKGVGFVTQYNEVFDCKVCNGTGNIEVPEQRTRIIYVLQNEGCSRNIWFDIYTFQKIETAREIREQETPFSGLNYRILKRTIIEEVME